MGYRRGDCDGRLAVGARGIHRAVAGKLAMMVFALDPGYEESAVVVFGEGRVLEHMTRRNEDILTFIRGHLGCLVIEQVESFGMPVGKEIFETVYFSGRCAEAWKGSVDRIPRREVKLHLCATSRAKDAHVRQALLDRFGPGKEKAIGRKASPGPLYAVSGDEWAALALAVTWWDLTAAQTRKAG